MEIERRYMARALQLARNGLGHVSPNPMVGAVIVRNGVVIGEGWHRCFGEGHAEVNAVASVRDKSLLRDATMYVTLEPCSHFGKTPPCADLIIGCGIPRVVVATTDPFEKVSGQGVEKLRQAGVEVYVGLMEREARALNKTFFYAHTHGRPYVVLKWAQSADGYIDVERPTGVAAARFSTPATTLMVQRLRACVDAIAVGSGTVIRDNPSLEVHTIEGRSPMKVVFDRRGRVNGDWALFDTEVSVITIAEDSLGAALESLYARGVTSLLVEGGKRLLDGFMAEGLWQECRVEVSPVELGQRGRCRMMLPEGHMVSTEQFDGNTVLSFRNDS